MQSSGGPTTNRSGPRTINLSGITLQDLGRLLNTVGRGAHVLGEEDEVTDEGEDQGGFSDSSHTAPHQWFKPVTEPQKAGVELINSGDFGRVANRARVRRNDVNVAKFLINRPRRPQPFAHKEDYAHVRRHPPSYNIPFHCPLEPHPQLQWHCRCRV